MAIWVLAPLGAAAPLLAAQSLPDGPARQTVQTLCTACHELRTVTDAGHTREDWRTVLHMMVNAGAPLPAAQFDNVLDYLAVHFPEKPIPPAVLLAGKVQASIRDWALPIAGSRPHDPLAAPDGSIWYSGQMASVLGRLEPDTGKITEFHTRIPGSGPHGLVMDTAGNVWFTANFQGYIGKFDPHTRTFTEYPLPDPKARDPHTPLFDAHGRLWFTVQGANMVGRLDPASGQFTEWPSPGGLRSLPYGIAVTHGAIWYSESGVKPNTIVRFDPHDTSFQSWAIPSGGGVIRNMMTMPDGNIAIAESGVNRVGLVAIKGR
ncbi:MAG TPA: hypothetical protein VN859_06035 [Steroidobacteraceae bacterium]|nr:hypothetical protein [Steroidobacteraceae bacterium]